MRTIVIAFLTLLTMHVKGQSTTKAQIIPDTIKIKVETDTNGKSIFFPKKIKTGVKAGNTYIITIEGLNSVGISLKAIAKSMEVYSPTPDLLKPILPGIPGSLSHSHGIADSLSGDELLIKMINEKIKRLNELKAKSEELHKETQFVVGNVAATTILNEISVLYGQVDYKGVKKVLTSDQQFLLALEEFLEQLLVKEPEATPDKITLYATIKQTASELKKTNYNFYLDYIFHSTTAIPQVMSKPFTAAKDLVELRMILTDNYSKDTLANEVKTLYTKGGNGFGLSFSTGFFYTEMLSDRPYYFKIIDPATGSKQIVEDKRVVSDVSIGGMAHGYWKVSSELRLGPSIGLALSPFDGKPRYLAGGSVLIGREKMVGLNFGWAWAKTKILPQEINTTTIYPKDTALSTIDKISSSIFVGVTYNLFAPRK